MPDPEAQQAEPGDDAPHPSPVRVGISSCLLGEAVRFDAQHKRHDYLCDVLGDWFEWVPQCPEMSIGLGVPREPIQLRRIAGDVHIVGVKSPSLDVTDALRAHAAHFAKLHPDLDGYVLKDGSPSCGLERVRVYDEEGAHPKREGTGGFAAALREYFPQLPMEEEGRLGDPRLRENFVLRVFVHHRWRRLCRKGLTPSALVAFHSDHKLMLMAHDPQAYRQLGRMIARTARGDMEAIVAEYFPALMSALAIPASAGRHANVLQHIAGYFRKELGAADRAELAELIDAYRMGLVPLLVPLTLINHHLRHHPQPYIQRQHYLEPYPPELRLRNL